ncbi:MAG: hypothetical protein MI974_15040 [Chitinophagales bacterium]|nr:hypothetical protein [Chitinophagales bacterium]
MRFEEEMFYLDALEELSIHYIEYDKPPAFIFNNFNLKFLLLRLSDEEGLTPDFIKLKNLKTANLTFRHFDFSSDRLLVIKELKKLSIDVKNESYNQLPNEFGSFDKLEQLKLDIDLDGDISTLAKLPNLKYLWVNSLSNFDENLDELQKLKHLKGFFVENMSIEHRAQLEKIVPIIPYHKWPALSDSH